MENKTKLMVSTVDKVLDIKAAKKAFPNTANLFYEFKAGVPQEVPDYIADSYAASYPNTFSIVDSKAKVDPPKEVVPPVEGKPGAFDAKVYLNNNPSATEAQLMELSPKDLFAVGEALGLKVSSNGNKAVLAGKVAHDLKVKNQPVKKGE